MIATRAESCDQKRYIKNGINTIGDCEPLTVDNKGRWSPGVHGYACLRALGTRPIGEKACAESRFAFSARPQSCALRKPFVKCALSTHYG